MKGAIIKVDPRRIVEALRENEEAHRELDQYDAPSGSLRERIQAVASAFVVGRNARVDERSALIARCEELEGALRQIATPKRPDGTYNLSREACQEIAREALDERF